MFKNPNVESTGTVPTDLNVMGSPVSRDPNVGRTLTALMAFAVWMTPALNDLTVALTSTVPMANYVSLVDAKTGRSAVWMPIVLGDKHA